jgi:hypothetical protein
VHDDASAQAGWGRVDGVGSPGAGGRRLCVRWLDELIVALWHDLQAHMEWKVVDQTLRETRGWLIMRGEGLEAQRWVQHCVKQHSSPDTPVLGYRRMPWAAVAAPHVASIALTLVVLLNPLHALQQVAHLPSWSWAWPPALSRAPPPQQAETTRRRPLLLLLLLLRPVVSVTAAPLSRLS